MCPNSSATSVLYTPLVPSFTLILIELTWTGRASQKTPFTHCMELPICISAGRHCHFCKITDDLRVRDQRWLHLPLLPFPISGADCRVRTQPFLYTIIGFIPWENLHNLFCRIADARAPDPSCTPIPVLHLSYSPPPLRLLSLMPHWSY